MFKCYSTADSGNHRVSIKFFIVVVKKPGAKGSLQYGFPHHQFPALGLSLQRRFTHRQASIMYVGISNLLFYLFSFIPAIKQALFFFLVFFKGNQKGSYRGSRTLKVVMIVFLSGAFSILLFSFLFCTWG